MKVSIIVEALTGSFETDMKRSAKTAERAAKDVQESWKAAGAALGAAIAAGVSALTVLTKNSIENAAAMAEMAQKVGVSVEALSTLAYAAEQSGVGTDKLQSSLVKLAKNASDAAQGIGTAREGFHALGIDVRDSNGVLKDSDALLREVAEELSNYEDGANKTAIAVNIFGKAGADLLPLLNEGAEGIAELEKRAQSLGLQLSTETATAAEAFGDKVDDLRNLAKGFGNDVAGQLLPSLNQLADQMIEGGIQARAMGGGAEVLADGLKLVISTAYVGRAAVESIVNVLAGAVDATLTFGQGLIAAFQSNVQSLREYQNALLSGDISAAWDALAAAPGKAEAIARTTLDRMRSSFEASGAGITESIDEVTDALEALWRPTKEAGDSIDETAQAADRAAPALGGLAAANKALAESEKEAARAAAELNSFYERITAEADSIIEAQNAAALETQKRFAQQAIDIQTEIDLLDMSTDAREAATIALEAERLARDENGKVIDSERIRIEKLLRTLNQRRKVDAILFRFEDTGIGELLRGIDDLKAALAGIGDATGEAFDPKHVAEMESALAQMNAKLQVETLGGFEALLGAMQTFASEGSRSFEAIKVGMAALSIVQDIIALKAAVIAVLTQGEGEPYTAFARMAAMAAAVAPFLASIGQTLSSLGGGGGGFTNTAEQRQETQGTGSVLGDAEAKSESILRATEITADATSQLVGINLGMLHALQALESGIGSASGMLARGAGNADFGSLPTPRDLSAHSLGARLGLPSFVNRLLGGSSEITDQGIVIMGGLLSDMIERISVGAYQEVQSRSWRFGSRHTRERVVDVTDEFGEQFQLIIESIADTVREGALALGLLPADIEAALAAFRIEETRISLMDLSAEEQQAELEAVFSEIFDGLAGSVVPFIEQFQQIGEGLGETLVRVATGVQVTHEAMMQLGFSLDALDPEQFAQISEGLIAAAGGIEDFIAGMSTFVAAFASEEHRFLLAQDQITRAFAQFGLTVPATRDGMWELMQSLDATTEEGQAQIAMLLRLAGVADAYYDMLEDRAEALANAQPAIEPVLFDEAAARGYANTLAQINQQLSELDGTTDFQRTLRDIAAGLRRNIDSLNEQARAAGLAAARTEDLGRAHLLAARQAAQAIAQLEAAGRAIAAQLFGADGERLGKELERLRAQFEATTDGLTRIVLGAQIGGIESQIQAQEQMALRAERFGLATDLAGMVADLAGATGVTFAEAFQRITGGQGSLKKLAAALGLGSLDELTTYLEEAQADSYSLADLAATVTAGEQLIVDTLHGLFDEQHTPQFHELAPGPDGVVKPIDRQPIGPPISEIGKSVAEESAELREEVAGVRDQLGRVTELLAQIAANSNGIGQLAEIAGRGASNAAGAASRFVTLTPGKR